MPQRVVGLTGATLEHAPSVCQTCVWWLSRTGRTAVKERWIEKLEVDWGAWGALYREGGVTLHVSPGLGTTFVPVRLFARPEVTELVLRRSG